jgi:translation initiation factor IF-2
MRIHEFSKEVGKSSKEIIVKLAGLRISVKSHMSSIDEETEAKLRDIYGVPAKPAAPKVKEKAAKPAPKKEKPKAKSKAKPVAESALS